MDISRCSPAKPAPSAIVLLCVLIAAAFALPIEAQAHRSAAWVAEKRPVKKKAIRHVTKSVHKKVKRTAAKSKSRRITRRVHARAVYCLDLAKRRTLMARNADMRVPVASLTKLITALVVLDHMSLNKKVRVPSYVRRIPKSRAGLRPGDRLTVRDLLHGMLIGSANDCAETLASAYPGGKRKFIRAMNRKARSLGARKTFFYTPSGLDKKRVVKRKGKRTVRVLSNVSTAREIAKIARIAFSNRTIRSICQKRRYVMRGRKSGKRYVVQSTNRLLREGFPIVGGKTGYTNRAGHCLATKFRRGHTSLLIVVLGSPNHFRDTRLLYRMAMKKIRLSGIHARPKHKRHKSKSVRKKLASRHGAGRVRLFSSIY